MWEAYLVLAMFFICGCGFGAGIVMKIHSKEIRDIRKMYEKDHSEFKEAERKYLDAYEASISKAT